MNIAAVVRYMDLQKGSAFDLRHYITHDYYQMARKYGFGLITVMTEQAIEAAVRVCDGLIIPGSGTAINPAYFGGAPLDPPNVVDEYALDSRLIRAFFEAGKPIFGICGGEEALNVAFGGTLARVPDVAAHMDEATHTHEIAVEGGSFVYDVFGTERCTVNSWHRQCAGVLAPDFKAVAHTDDGVIEAFEWRERGIFATQWHPEMCFHQDNPTEERFFVNFFAECEKRR